METTKKNNAIQFYRFLLSLGILVFHFNVQFLGALRFPKGGYLGVEFFFILSGYFLMKTLKKSSHPKTAFDFWKRKIKALYPAYLMMLLLFILFDIFGRHYILSAKDLLLRLGDEIWDFLLLGGIGIPGFYAYEGTIWYLVSLSINSYVIYYLLLKHENVMKQFIVPLCCVLGYSYIGKEYGSLSMQAEWLGGGIRRARQRIS